MNLPFYIMKVNWYKIQMMSWMKFTNILQKRDTHNTSEKSNILGCLQTWPKYWHLYVTHAVFKTAFCRSSPVASASVNSYALGLVDSEGRLLLVSADTAASYNLCASSSIGLPGLRREGFYRDPKFRICLPNVWLWVSTNFSHLVSEEASLMMIE